MYAFILLVLTAQNYLKRAHTGTVVFETPCHCSQKCYATRGHPKILNFHTIVKINVPHAGSCEGEATLAPLKEYDLRQSTQQ
jgi:hypothetical protein